MYRISFAQNSFEKRKAATCRFSKEFCENRVNVLTNRKEGIKIQKEIVNALGVFKRVL
jgi:ectoine hydroxylase-related dioxygenase (phytanoyl-CoA dioxygenase family)